MESSRDDVKAIRHRDTVTSQKAGPFLNVVGSLGIEVSAAAVLFCCGRSSTGTPESLWDVMNKEFEFEPAMVVVRTGSVAASTISPVKCIYQMHRVIYLAHFYRASE